MKPLEGYQVEREGSHAVALELEIDESLRVEGWAREIVHAIQGARRDAGLDITDRIALTLDGAPQLLAAARGHQEYIAGETSPSRSTTRRSQVPARPDRRARAADRGPEGLRREPAR